MLMTKILRETASVSTLLGWCIWLRPAPFPLETRSGWPSAFDAAAPVNGRHAGEAAPTTTVVAASIVAKHQQHSKIVAIVEVHSRKQSENSVFRKSEPILCYSNA